MKKWIDKRTQKLFDKYRTAHNDVSICFHDFSDEIQKMASEIVREIVPERRKGTHTNHIQFDMAIDYMEENARRIGIDTEVK